jgi:hypothetical protein
VPPFLLRNLSLIAKAPRPREEMAEREARIVAP